MSTWFDHLDTVPAEDFARNYTWHCPRLLHVSHKKTETFIYLHITTSASNDRYGTLTNHGCLVIFEEIVPQGICSLMHRNLIVTLFQQAEFFYGVRRFLRLFANDFFSDIKHYFLVLSH